MLKRELEEQNALLLAENEELRSVIRSIHDRMEGWEEKLLSVLLLQEEMPPFQAAVENWLSIVKENLSFHGSRIAFVEERLERGEQETEKLNLYYRGLTQTMRRSTRYLKAFDAKLRVSSGRLDRLEECVNSLAWLLSLTRFFTHWKARR